MRAIAKALQLKGHVPDFAPVDLAYQHFLGFLAFLFENIVFSDVSGSSAWQPPVTHMVTHVVPRPLLNVK